MLLPVVLSPLQDECPLVVVVVNSWSLQTDGAFMDQRWMQRVQSWNALRNMFTQKKLT